MHMQIFKISKENIRILKKFFNSLRVCMLKKVINALTETVDV